MRFYILILSMIMGLFASAQGADWNHYPYQDPASEIKFPIDEGSHHVVAGLEWWYVVIHAVGENTGDKYSILVSHFNNETRFFNVTNVTKKTHVSGSTFGILKSADDYLDLTHQTPYGMDRIRTPRDSVGELIPFHYEMQTHYKNMELQAELISNKKPMMVGLDGYGAVGSSGNTWYYSLTSLELKGQLTFQGVTEPIHGLAWMDHQWGPFIVSPVQIGNAFESYEWFSIQLSSGYELMISNIYNRKNELPDGSDYGDVQLFDPSGHSIIARQSEFVRTRYWQDPVSHKVLSMGWALHVPEWNLNLDLKPEFEEQMVHFPLNGDFWEGSIDVQGSQNGQRVNGMAFGELLHSFKQPEIQFTNLQSRYDLKQPVELGWEVLNPDAGNPLTDQVFLLLDGKPSILLGEMTGGSKIKINLSQYLPEISAMNGFRLKIQGCSVDRFLCGEQVSPLLKLK